MPYSPLILFTLHLLLNPFPHSRFYQFFVFMDSLSNMLQFFELGIFFFNFSHVELGIILTCSTFLSKDARAGLTLGVKCCYAIFNKFIKWVTH